jgi:hypothetical protein
VSETTYRCPCGKRLEEPLQRVGNLRAMCPCGQLVRLDPHAQAAYAERAEPAHPRPEPPRAAPRETTEGPEDAPQPAGGRDAPAPAGSPSSWSEAERHAPAQLPAADEPDPEPETVPMPKLAPAGRDIAGWVAGA